jgi:hypothetical protein
MLEELRKQLKRPASRFDVIHAVCILSTMLIVAMINQKLVPWALGAWLVVDLIIICIRRWWKRRMIIGKRFSI